MPQGRRELTLAEAARALGGKSWSQVYRLILRGELEARQDTRDRWWITAASVREFRAKGNDTAGARAVAV